ncbi:hypothetical protein QBC38DRAFT_471389 [Podospora fimiseda]|uniref:Uncharacterized protein n=1 Tax=Podospora fimiseda TaxID=252190 RepID=A0AAN7H5J4_9PEZI|nr:hypothetical protein QBC38DRAFT_471389 [Podospora fimiseda]
MAGRNRHPASSSPVSTTPGRIDFQPATQPFTTWSPHLLGDSTKKIPRRYVKIPPDQTKALEKASVWGRGHVIAKVLEEAEARISREPATRPRDVLSSQLQRQEAPSSQPSSPPSHAKTAKGNDTEDEQDDTRTSISWASSPPEHFRNPRLQLPPAEEPVSSPLGPGKRLFNQQVTKNGQPQAFQGRSIHQPQLQSALLVDFAPGSSQPSETGVEVEPSRTVTAQVQERPHSAAAMIPQDPTPPSAQIIPATLPRAESASPEPTVKPKRRRLMKDITSLLESPATSDRRPSGTFAANKSAAHMLAVPSRSSHGVTPIGESSSYYDAQHAEETSSISATPIVPRDRRSPTLADQIKIITATPANVQEPKSSRSLDRPPNKIHFQDPFYIFCEEYPDYGGTLNTFIRATISLEEQQRGMLLSEFLYDDYVRVFSGPYLKYIESCLEEGVGSPLTAIQWYNRNVKVPVYMNRHLTERRVKEILQYYPGMVHEICEQARGPVGGNTMKNRRDTNTQTQVVKDTPHRPTRKGVSATEATNSLPSRPSPRRPTPVAMDVDSEISVHRAELASDPICTAEDFSPVTKSRNKATKKLEATPSFRSSGTGLARQGSPEDIESTDPRNGMNTPTLPTMTSPGFETQVARPSLDIQSSVPAVIEDTIMIDDVQLIEVRKKEPEKLSQQADVDEEPSQDMGVKRPWEAIEDPQMRAELQLKYWSVFLEKVYMPSRMSFLEKPEAGSK